MKKPLLDASPLQNLAGPMEIQVAPRRDFGKTEQFDPFQLAMQGQGFEMFHKDCGGRVKLRLKQQVRRLLSFPVSSKQSYEFVCTVCQEAYELERSGRRDLTDECSFTQQCLRRVLIEKQGPFGSTRKLNFDYQKP